MTKKEFLKITHKRTHEKVKEWLKGYTPNNVILRYLWIALSLLIRAIVAVVGRITYFITLRFIDIEFDIKYMEVEIEVLGLSPAEAHEYLKKKEQEFIRLGASHFSTLSTKREREIEKALKYMYNIYPAPPVVEDDTKHNEIIGKFSDAEQRLATLAEDNNTQHNEVMDNISNVGQNVTTLAEDNNTQHSEVMDNISNLKQEVIATAKENNAKQDKIIKGITDIKQKQTATAEDTQQLDILKNIDGRIDVLQQGADTIVKNTELIKDNSTTIEIKESVDKIVSHNQQEEAEKIKSQQERDAERREAELSQGRKKRGRRFETSPTNMESRLSEEQTIILVDHINIIKVFARHITRTELEDIFLCIHHEPLRVTHNKIITILFEKLAANSLISPKWRRVADNNKCFESKTGKLLLSKDFSAANQAASLIDPEKGEMINDCIEDIISAK